MITKTDEKYIQRCLDLAILGKGNVAPNPMVGCVVLNSNGEIISEGYHKKYGENHAERDALLKLKKEEAQGGTLYVNLEPCSHQGKTPPCTDLIIEYGIKKVVFASIDPNPEVNGVRKLEEAGIEVIQGVLKEKADFLNRVFFKNIKTNLPYVVLKTATTMDGKIATKLGSSKWITSEESRDEVYKMRKEFDCILTSSNTVIADNPTMEHSFKCILDKDLRTNSDLKIYQQGNFYIASSQNTPLKNGKLDLKSVFHNLYNQNIYTVFVECGGTLAGSLLRENLVDEIYQFIAPKILNDNDGFSCFNGDNIETIDQSKDLEIYSVEKIGADVLIRGLLESPV